VYTYLINPHKAVSIAGRWVGLNCTYVWNTRPECMRV